MNNVNKQNYLNLNKYQSPFIIMDYTNNQYSELIDYYKKIKFVYLSAEESKSIKDCHKKSMIKAKREHIKNQVLSRKKSLEIIFNA